VPLASTSFRLFVPIKLRPYQSATTPRSALTSHPQGCAISIWPSWKNSIAGKKFRWILMLTTKGWLAQWPHKRRPVTSFALLV
jgi:hypothetical protein